MKTLSWKLLAVSVLLTTACAKQDSGGNSGSNAIPAPAPSNCTPDGAGNVPVGCAVISTANLTLSGDLILNNEKAGVNVIRDFPGQIQVPWSLGGWALPTSQCAYGGLSGAFSA